MHSMQPNINLSVSMHPMQPNINDASICIMYIILYLNTIFMYYVFSDKSLCIRIDLS